MKNAETTAPTIPSAHLIEPVVFRMKADIKDRQPGGQEKAVDHPHQDQNLNDNGYNPQFCSSVSDIRVSLNPNPAQAG